MGIIQSQKARGLLDLQKDSYAFYAPDHARIKIWHEGDDVPAFPFFARPCPLRPRHGFVESRLVQTKEEFDQVVAEIKATDEPLVEIICMPLLDSIGACIISPDGVTLANTRTGATDGTQALFIPCPTSATDYGYYVVGNHISGIADGEVVFIEGQFIRERQRSIAVQARSGPSVGVARDFIPPQHAGKEIREVHRPGFSCAPDDLLAWEKLISGLPLDGSVVVNIPDGTLHSHYAVHAILRGIPVIVSRSVWIGDTIPAQSSGDKGTWGTKELLLAREAFRSAWEWEIEESVVKSAIAALHAAAAWEYRSELVRLTGWALGVLSRSVLAAIIAELRHYRSRGPGRWYRTPDWIADLPKGCRREVLETAAALPFDHVIHLINVIPSGFAGRWVKHYGGAKWKKIAKVWQSLVASALVGSPNKFHDAIKHAHTLINIEHNTGSLMDRWVSRSALDLCAKVPVCFLARLNVLYAAQGKLPKKGDVQ